MSAKSKPITCDGMEPRDEKISVHVEMECTNRSVLAMRHESFSATFDHDGLKGEASWPVGGTCIQVTLSEPGKSWATYTFSLHTLVEQALKAHAERFPKEPQS